MNGVDRVKAICKDRKIPISKLEKDLGYANGYIGQLRKGVFPSDRLMEIASYLSVSPMYILTGKSEEKEKSPDQLELTEGEVAFIKLLRRIPAEDRPIVIEKILSALDTQE